MFCYSCGAELSEHDFCTACGADVAVYKKILALANRYYNEGLGRAQVRDLSGAVASLRQCLKCYKYHTDARNLLGLVYFEMGEFVDAMSEWVISTNLQPEKNIASDYLETMQSNLQEWGDIRIVLHKYNLALGYCHQDSIDLAIIQLKKVVSLKPNHIRGQLLLALLFMADGELERARRCIYRVLSVDTNNTTALQYAKEIEDALIRREEERTGRPSRRRKKKQQQEPVEIVSYQSGNDTIIQPLNNPEKLAGGFTILNIVIGLIIGAAVMWFCVLPARISKEKADANKSVVEVSNQLTERSASMDQIQKRVDALEAENTELLSQVSNLTGSDGLMKAADVLMTATRDYLANPDDVTTVAEALDSIDPIYLTDGQSSQAFQALYSALSSEIGSKAAGSYLAQGLDALKDSNYSDAITNLTKAYELNTNSVEALYNLGHAYRRSDNMQKAQDCYKQVISKFPDTEYAKNAKEYVSGGSEPAEVSSPTGNTSESTTAEPEQNATEE